MAAAILKFSFSTWMKSSIIIIDLLTKLQKLFESFICDVLNSVTFVAIKVGKKN